MMLERDWSMGLYNCVPNADIKKRRKWGCHYYYRHREAISNRHKELRKIKGASETRKTPNLSENTVRNIQKNI